MILNRDSFILLSTCSHWSRAVELTSAKYEVVVIPDVNRTSADTEMHPVPDTAPVSRLDRFRGSKVTGPG